MWCQCSDQSLGVGLYTVKELRPICGPSVQFFCPAEITTWSATGFYPPDIFVVVKPTIIGCTLF